MDTVSIWRFDTSEGAEAALRALEPVQRRRLVVVDDLAVVVWPRAARRPHAYQVGTEAGTTELSGAFWGLLFGLVFLLPLAGVVVDAGVLARVGFADELVAQLREQVTHGTSALFLLTDRAAVDRVREALAGTPAGLLLGSLAPEQVAVLRRAFDDAADDDDVPSR